MTTTLGQALQRDLAPFADPATDIRLTESSKTSRLQFVRSGQPLDYLLLHEDGSLLARHANDRKYVGIHSLLASSDFADIRNLVATQNRIHREFDLESLIPPEGELDGKKLAFQTMTRVVMPAQRGTSNKLGIMLLDGPAGVGKTSLIQRLLVQRARSAQDVSAAPPILQVASRGKRLSSLDDVLAQSLQLIRAKFTFDQLPPLIRHGLIQLAIDGFDELVDPEGYRDAWFALRDFFEITQFGGPIILAGRDTFLDEQQFSAQMAVSNQEFELHHARLSEVSPVKAKTWLATQGWQAKDIEDPYTDLILRPGSYTLRPYFLRELASAKNWSNIESRDLTPRAYLVEQFLERESDILAEKVPLNPVDLKARLASVFEEVAVEMADTETDAVDLSFLQMTTELTFGDVLGDTDVAKLRHKSGSFGLLSNDARQGFRRFPHSEITYHFLSLALLRLVASGEPTRFLRRGVVGSDLLAILAEQFVSCEDARAAAFVTSLEKALAREASFDRLPENAASLLLTTLNRDVEGRSATYSDLQAPNVFLFGDVATSILDRVEIQRLDAAEASLVNVQFRNCEVVNLHVDETTMFGDSTPTIHRLHVRTPKGEVRPIFDPVEIAAWVGAHTMGSPAESSDNESAITLLDKVCRVMLRQHMIKDHETDDAGRLLRNPYWPAIEQILTEFKMIDRVRGKQMAGAHAPFVRMKDPFKLLAQRSAVVNRSIWRKVAEIPK
jgi:hypothetical protein